MATKKETRYKKVREATERWFEMETSELLYELNELKTKEDLLLEELPTIRALRRALEGVLRDRDVDMEYPEDSYPTGRSPQGIQIAY